MGNTSPRAKSLKRQAVTITVLLVLAAAYFAVIVPRKNAYFTDRYFRLLAGTGDQLQVTIANLGSALVNAEMGLTNTATLAADLPEGSLRQAVLTASTNATPTPSDRRERIERIKAAFDLIPNLELVGSPEIASNTNQSLRLEVVPGPRGPALEFDYEPKYEPGWTNYQLKARSNLGRLLQSFVNRGEFDDLLLVNTNYEVLYQLGGSAMRLARLEVPLDRSARTNLLNLAGHDYLVFTQPLQINLAARAGAEASGRKWILCGLVGAEHFRTQTWSVSYRVLEGFAFVALLLIASWPFLNVLGLGLKGGLRVAETFLVAFSLLFVTALLTFLALDDFAYTCVDDQLEKQAQPLAERIEANLQAELQAVADQVAALGQLVVSNGLAVNRANILKDAWAASPLTAPYPWLRGVCWIGTNGQQAVKWTVRQENTPTIRVAWRDYFRTIKEGRAWRMKGGWLTNGFFLEPIFSSNTGENFAAFSTVRTQDPGVVAEMDLRPLSLMNSLLPDGWGFAVIATNGLVLFHSDEQRNLRENFFEECENNHRLLAAVAGRTTDQFDGSYFQQRQNLRVSPLADLPWSLVVFRAEKPLQVAHIEVVSVAGGWFLIYATGLLLGFGALRIFRGQRAARWLWPRPDLAATYRWVATCNLALLSLGAIVALLNFDPWVTLAVGVVLPAAGLVGTRLVLRRHPIAPRWPGALVAKLRNQARRWARRSHGPDWLQYLALVPRWDDHRYGYVSAFSSLLLLAAFLPTLAFVKLASDTEMELVIKQAQLHLARDFEAREQRVRAEVMGFQTGDGSKNRPLVVPNPEEFILRRLTNRWDVYDQFFFRTTVQRTNLPAPVRATPLPRQTFLESLAHLRPHYTSLDVEARGLLPDVASDASWHWGRTRSWTGFSKKQTFVKNSSGPSGASGEGFVTVQSTVPQWQLPGPIRWVGFVLLLCLPFVMVYLVAEKILFLSVDPTPRFDARVWSPGKYLLLGPPHSRKGDWLIPKHFPMLAGEGRPAPLFIDLRKAEGRAWLEEASQDKLFEHTGQPIIVDHFEYDLTNPEFNRKKFLFLQQFAADEKRPMILVSNVHPLNFPVATGPEGKPAATLSRLLREDLLSSFKRISKEDKDGNPLVAPPADTTTFTAQAHYRSLFATCSPQEQQILHQVADGRLISCGQPEIQTLLGRGLLKLAPDLRLMDDFGLRAFVLSHHRPDVEEGVKEETSIWYDLKGPAITVLIIVAAFFFFTQRAVWDYTIAVVPAFLAGITALTQIPRLLQMLKSKPPPGP